MFTKNNSIVATEITNAEAYTPKEADAAGCIIRYPFRQIMNYLEEREGIAAAEARAYNRAIGVLEDNWPDDE